MTQPALDEAVYAASKELRGRGAPDPDVLFLLKTGTDVLPASYRLSWRLPLEGVAGLPQAWRGAELLVAEAEGATFWFLPDAPGEEETGNAPELREAPWVRGFPVWLAACSGASLCVHTSAGLALECEDGEQRSGTLALLSDHINLSGRTPLLGLGSSRLGSIFPDQTTLHHQGLRRTALRGALARGLPVSEAIAACLLEPAQLTPAERHWLGSTGAQVGVFGLADPLLAMAHAGLSCLSIVAVIEESEGLGLKQQIEAAERLAPSLHDLIDSIAPDLARLAFELREEVM